MTTKASRIDFAREELSNISRIMLQLGQRVERIREGMLNAAAELPARGATNTSAARSDASVPSHPVIYGLRTNPALTAKVQTALALRTKKEAEATIGIVIAALEETLTENLDRDGFSIKLGSFGKFSIRHKRGVFRKIPFTGELKMTNPKRKVKFVALGRLRQLENAHPENT